MALKPPKTGILRSKNMSTPFAEIRDFWGFWDRKMKNYYWRRVENGPFLPEKS